MFRFVQQYIKEAYKLAKAAKAAKYVLEVLKNLAEIVSKLL